jgi:hypothetical protein
MWQLLFLFSLVDSNNETSLFTFQDARFPRGEISIIEENQPFERNDW